MCGIAGAFIRSGDVFPDATRFDVARMTSRLAHRGPDGDGIWHAPDAAVCFGHRRLSIIDLSDNGRQPMLSADKRVAVTYNGEIYNFMDIRDRLVSEGKTFKGHSDTEVLIEAIAAWGWRKTLPLLNGMFALAIWDSGPGELILARDRTGQKPLYWGDFEGTVLFASEIKAIRTHPKFNASVNRDALHAYIARSYVPSPLSIYEGLNKLAPGMAVVCRRDRSLSEPMPFTSPWRSVVTQGAETTPGDLKQILCSAISRHLVADVPVSLLLSGGIDSSLIAALAAKELSHPMDSYVARFDDHKIDESAHAQEVGRALGISVEELRIDHADIQATVSGIADIYDEPFADSSQIPTLLILRAVRRSAKVVLSGDGADELFFGYDRYALMLRLAPLLAKMPASFRIAMGMICQTMGQQCLDPIYGVVSKLTGQHIDARRLSALSRVFEANNFDESYRGMLSQWSDPSSILTDAMQAPTGYISDKGDWNASSGDIMDYLQSLDVATYLPDDLMVKTDRASMSVGLEARMPFLDVNVLSAASRVSHVARYKAGRGKGILRTLLSDYVSDDIINRPKQGFSAPIASWLRGELREWAGDLLHDVRMRDDGFFRPQLIKRMWHEHCNGVRDWSSALWTILMFQQWRRSDNCG